MNETSFGARLDQAMNIRDLEPKELAHKSGVSLRYIHALLSGERESPTTKKAIALARALDVSLDWLAGLPPRTPSELTPYEDEMLTEFRALGSDEARRHILTVIKSLKEV